MILYSDFETSTELVDGKVNVYLWGLVSEDNTIRKHGIDLDSFFYEISKLPEEPVIYFHNITWDGNFIVHYLIDNGYTFAEKVSKKSAPKTFTWIADYNTNIYKLVVRTKFGIITFLDSYKVLVSSVEKLGKALNLPKLEIDYDKYKKFNTIDEVPQELIDYLYRDIDVVKDFMRVFSEKVQKVKTTIAGTMYYEFQNFYGRHNFAKDFGSPTGGNNLLTKDEWLKIKRSYNGGFTAISPRYVGVDITNIKGHSYDWNSMYPGVMKDNRMPYGKPTRFKVEDTDLELYVIRIIKAVKSDPLVPAMLPNGSTGVYIGKYLDEAEDMSIHIWKEEWEAIKRFYDVDYFIEEILYFRSKYVFKEFIEAIMVEKTNAKDEVERFIAKIKQNSLYGKFGESIERESKILVEDAEKVLSGKRYGVDQNWVEQKIIHHSNTISYIPIASYITSMSRTMLFNAIHDNRDTFIYCDTDSLYLTNEGKNLKIDDRKYGYLKLEHKFTRFKAIKLKCYMLLEEDGSTIIKVAGLPESGKKLLNFDNFYRGFRIESSKLQKKHNIGGLLLEEIDYTL